MLRSQSDLRLAAAKRDGWRDPGEAGPRPVQQRRRCPGQAGPCCHGLGRLHRGWARWSLQTPRAVPAARQPASNLVPSIVALCGGQCRNGCLYTKGDGRTFSAPC
eukprot:3660437-Amphidinium_carterae.1